MSLLALHQQHHSTVPKHRFNSTQCSASHTYSIIHSEKHITQHAQLMTTDKLVITAAQFWFVASLLQVSHTQSVSCECTFKCHHETHLLSQQ